MDCIKCGHQIPPNAQYCVVCGSIASQSVEAHPHATEYYFPSLPFASKRAVLISYLPVLGGIAAGIGLILLWNTLPDITGLDLIKPEIDVFFSPQIGNADLLMIQFLLMALAIFLRITLVAAVFGFLTLTDSRGVRTMAVVLSVLALTVLSGVCIFVASSDFLTLQYVIDATMLGWALAVGGLLCMIFTPLLARKSQPGTISQLPNS